MQSEASDGATHVLPADAPCVTLAGTLTLFSREHFLWLGWHPLPRPGECHKRSISCTLMYSLLYIVIPFPHKLSATFVYIFHTANKPKTNYLSVSFRMAV